MREEEKGKNVLYAIGDMRDIYGKISAISVLCHTKLSLTSEALAEEVA